MYPFENLLSSLLGTKTDSDHLFEFDDTQNMPSFFSLPALRKTENLFVVDWRSSCCLVSSQEEERKGALTEQIVPLD